MKNITHLAVHHDPEGRCNDLLRKHVSELKLLFTDGFIITTRKTYENQETRNLLEQAGFRLTARSTIREDQVLTAGHIALLAGHVKAKGDSLFFGCLDRTLHWLENYPEELKKTLTEGIVDNDYLIIGRTDRALETHPPVQLEPEIETNKTAARLLGMSGVDVGTGCFMLNKKTAKNIVSFLREENIFTTETILVGDLLWPYIVHLLDLKIGFIKTEGLEFETPDQYRKEIKELGYEKWLEQNFTTANIERRMLRVKETEQTLVAFSEKYNSGRGGREQIG